MSDAAFMAMGLTIPFAGTVLGSAMVFFMKDKINEKLQKLLLGFASGVMLAASIWSLLIPSIEQGKATFGEQLSWIPAAVGFACGIGFLLLIDTLTPHLHVNSHDPEGIKKHGKMKNTSMMMLAVTIHNIPEGMAAGVVMAGYLSGNTSITMLGALTLTIGLAIQNFPEGAIISMPFKAEGNGKFKSFALGAVSGIVEPIGAIIMILLTQAMTVVLPYFLAFAAGAMIYVVVEELIPEAQTGKHSNLTVMGLAVGFLLMMILDIALG